MRLTPCECNEPGWCERHGCFKPQYQFQLCRRYTQYFELWEAGNGPCLAGEVDPDMRSDGPGLVRRAVNLTQAVVRHTLHGAAEVDEATYQRRLECCRNCPSCEQESMICREQACGCFLRIKARWESEACPLGHWSTSGPPIRA